MTDLEGGKLRFSPSRARYWIVGPFLAAEGLFFLALLGFSASLIADGVHDGGAIFWLVIGAAVVWFCGFATSYARNAATLNVIFDNGLVNIQTGNENTTVSLSDINKICFLDTLRGWMYIILYAENKSYTITNMMYFDSEFISIRKQIENWLKEIGKPDLVYIDSVTGVGFTRDKKLPPFIYAGLWRCILVYGLILIAITAVCVTTGFRPAALLRVH